jgi:mycofactocin precursor
MISPADSLATDESPTPEPAQPERYTSQTEPPREAPLVEVDLLVEDVSIDGMCGVY